MHGFFCSIGKPVTFDTSRFNQQMVRRNTEGNLFSFEQVTTPKFANDKVFADGNKYFFAIEGIIVNDDELLDKYGKTSLEELIPEMYERKGKHFFNEFRGSYCGVFYDKQKGECTFYNDHIGDHILVFAEVEGSFLIASDLKILNKARIAKGLKPAINETAVRMLIGCSYLFPGVTLLEGVARLSAGECITVKVCNKPTYEIEQYHLFKNDFKEYTEAEAIEGIDYHFRKAVERIIKKNRQYGYDHYSSLSAGMDSRMTTWVLRNLTTDRIYNVTYSQSGYEDEIVPRQMAEHLDNEMLFTPLDGGEHLISELDDMLNTSEGFVYYGASAEALHIFKTLKDKNIGCLATGMFGDMILSTGIKNRKVNSSYTLNYCSVTSDSYILQDYLPDDFYTRYPSREIVFLYLRGFCDADMGTPIVIQPFAESYSPFLDVDFLEYTYSIPIEMRHNYNLYDKWVLAKYPDAALWKHNKKFTVGKRNDILITIRGRNIYLKELPKRLCWFILKKLHIANFYQTTEGNSMSPEDSWINNNAQLRAQLDEKFENNIDVLNQFAELKNKVTDLYYKGVSQDKEIALTVVCAIKRLLS